MVDRKFTSPTKGQHPMPEKKPTLGEVCALVCEYLGTKDAYTGELVDHCECSEITFNRASQLLRKVGAPLRLIRNSVGGRTEFYWTLDRKLTQEEADAYGLFACCSEERAQRLLNMATTAAQGTS
jgi:hypothetical protein